MAKKLPSGILNWPLRFIDGRWAFVCYIEDEPQCPPASTYRGPEGGPIPEDLLRELGDYELRPIDG